MRSMKSECHDKLIFFGEKSLRRALTEFEQHYHSERNHQGLGNEVIEPGAEVGPRPRRYSRRQSAWSRKR